MNKTATAPTYSKVFYRWLAPHRCMAIAFASRLCFGRYDTLFVRTWSFGPITVAITDLTRR